MSKSTVLALPAATVAEESASSQKPRVAVLFYRLGPYHCARLKAAGSHLHVTAVEFSNVDPIYAWDLVSESEGFERTVLFSGTPVSKVPTRIIIDRMSEVLGQLCPHVVAIPGWADRCSLAALRWCRVHRIPVVIMSETTAWDDQRKWWKEALKRQIVKSCPAGLVGGRPHAEYLATLGIRAANISIGYDVVDNEHFAKGGATAKAHEQETRRKYGLPKRYFLASARFVGKKNLSRLVDGYARYRAGVPQPDAWDLVLLGDGNLRTALELQISMLGLRDHLILPGFKQYDELPAFYGLAKAFIHASVTEQWGLVVNEAMAAGLPVLVSERCGCAMDLVQEGVNGFTFDPNNIEQIGTLLARVSESSFPLSSFGMASLRLIENIGPERFAQGLKQAVGTAVARQPARASAIERLILFFLGQREFSYE